MEAIRCFSCGKVLGGKHNTYRQLIQTKSAEEAMNILQVKRYCCRRMLLTSVDIASKVIDYNQVHDTMSENLYVNSKKKTVDGAKRTYLAR